LVAEFRVIRLAANPAATGGGRYSRFRETF
jgi:hypothetical protein